MSLHAQVALLPDGRRLHLQHGPIDIIAEAFGAQAEVARAYQQAGERIQTIMEELVGELPRLRERIGPVPMLFNGAVERRMFDAAWPHRSNFVTPMVAVAGAVADEVLATMCDGRALDKAYVNNGGDIALYLNEGQSFTAGIVTNNDAPTLDGNISIPASSRVRGIATSGWRGRSLSMGVADSVTVLAADAAAADAAATMIANATDVAHPAVKTAPARSVRDDTDLGERMVTVDVGPLDDAAINIALTAGTREAEIHRSRKLIVGACISLQGHQRCIDGLDEMERQAS